MSLQRIIAIRIAMGALIAWVILTIVFAMFTMTDDWVLAAEIGMLRWAGASEEVLEAVRQEYFQERGLDRPLWQAYLNWMGNMVLLDWGDSFVTEESALGMVIDGIVRTAMYVIPAFILAITGGIIIGLFAAIRRHDRLPSMVVFGVYLVFIIPMFWLGGMALSFYPGYGGFHFGETHWMYHHALPILLTTAALLGGYVSYARAHSLEYVGRDFTKLVKAKGAANVLVARHVLRNAAIPFVSMLFTEVILLLLIAVFVIEAVFGINGFGMTFLDAAGQRDLPVLLGCTIIVIGLGVVGNIIQDISYSYFDPRVDTGGR